jgi:hypothetical protein
MHFLAFGRPRGYPKAIKRATAVLHLFRLLPLVLVLSFLTATTTVDLWPVERVAVVSTPSNSGTVAKLALAKLNLIPAKLSTAEMEDGPEGEEAPLATFVRAYDGDDQIQTRYELVFAAVGFIAPADDVNAVPPELTYPTYGGFPTGPPAV